MYFFDENKIKIMNFLWENNNYDYLRITTGFFFIVENNGEMQIKIILDEDKKGENIFYGKITISGNKYLIYFSEITFDVDFIGKPFISDL